MVTYLPQNTDAVKKYGKKYDITAPTLVYDGPFKLTGWNGNNNSWILVKNSDYWDKKAIKLKAIKVSIVKDANTAHQMFQGKNLDVATVSGTTAQGTQKDKAMFYIKRGGIFFLDLNVRKGHVLRNAKLRAAVSLVLNRKQLAQKVLADGSKADSTFVAPGIATDPNTGKDFAAENRPAKVYDPTQAKKLWQQGLKEIGKKHVELSILGDDQTVSKNVCQFVQSQLQEHLPGLKVEVRNIPFKALLNESRAGNYDLEYETWLSDFADPISTLQIMEIGNSINSGYYANARYNHLLRAATSNTVNQRTYWQDLSQAEKQIDSDHGVIPLFSIVEDHLVNPNLKGIQWNAVGETDYTRAYFK